MTGVMGRFGPHHPVGDHSNSSKAAAVKLKKVSLKSDFMDLRGSRRSVNGVISASAAYALRLFPLLSTFSSNVVRY
jgi:hypothetical protein